MTNVLLGKAHWVLDAELAAAIKKFHLEAKLVRRVSADGYTEFHSPERLAENGRLFLQSVDGVAVGGFAELSVVGVYREFEWLNSIGVSFTWVSVDLAQRGVVVALQDKNVDDYFKGKGFVEADDIEYGFPMSELRLLSQSEFEATLNLLHPAPLPVEPNWDALNESLRNYMDSARDEYQRGYEAQYGAGLGYDIEFNVEALHWEIDALAGLSDGQIERFWEQSEYQQDEHGLLWDSVNTLK